MLQPTRNMLRRYTSEFLTSLYSTYEQIRVQILNMNLSSLNDVYAHVHRGETTTEDEPVLCSRNQCFSQPLAEVAVRIPLHEVIVDILVLP